MNRQTRQVPVVVAVVTVFALIGGTLLLMPSAARPAAFLSPIGLMEVLRQQTAQRLGPTSAGVALLLSYATYVFLFGALMRACKWSTFGIVTLVLGCVLLLDLAGWQKITGELSNIQ